MQDQHVVEGGEQRRIQQRVVLTARHLRDDHLSIRSGTDDLVGVARRDAGDVRAMEAGAALARRRIVVTIRIVIGEGELLRDVDAGLALTQLGRERSDLLRGERGRSRERARERLVGRVDTRVDDGDDLAFALLRDLVGAHHQLGTQVGGVLPAVLRGLEASLGIEGRAVVHVSLTLEERCAHARGTTDRVERTGGSLESKTRQDVIILVLHLGRGTGELSSHSPVDLADRALAGCAILELDDDADDARRILIVGTRGGRGLPGLRGECSVDIARRQGRRCAIAGAGRARGQGRGQGGRPGDRERARADEGEEGSRFLR